MYEINLADKLGFQQKRTLRQFLLEYVQEHGNEKGPQRFWNDVHDALQGVLRKSYFDRIQACEAAKEQVRLKESADSSDLASTVANIKPVQQVYRTTKQLAYDTAWRSWIGETDVPDFRLQEVADMGSFPDLPIVAENAEFEDDVKLPHREWTIRTLKRGRVFNLSFEAQVNDSIGRLRQVFGDMGIAAVRTLARHVAAEMFANPPTPYDGFQLWCYDHRNVLTDAIDGINLTNANRLDLLCTTMLMQRDQQKDVKSGTASGNFIVNRPAYLVCGYTQWEYCWHLVNDDMIPNDAGTLMVNNPMRKHRDAGLEVVLFPYLDEAAGGTCDNVYLFAAPTEYTPALMMAYLEGTGRGPILAMSAPQWRVTQGLSDVQDFDIYLKRKFLVMEFAHVNPQVWEGTSAIIPAFQPGAGERQDNPWA